tara:strand:- start:1778 stop:2221 length:444 start_codon:yes stop_codon:yes gene_type:complete
MSNIKFKVKNMRQFKIKKNEQKRDTESNVQKVVASIANNIRNTAVVSILQNARAGNEVTRYNPTRTIRTSKAGDPPASDSGFLANQISLKISANKFEADIISNADYSEALEFGTLKMAARPFMQPAAEQARSKFRNNITKAIKSGLK